MLLLAVQTGLRVSELIGLRCADVHLGTGAHVGCRGKGRKERIVPFGSKAKQALSEYLPIREKLLREHKTGEAALFLNARGRRLTARSVDRLLKKYVRALGPNVKVSPHSLRHTFARSYLVNGGDVFSLQRILGHTSLDMVKRYVALTDSDLAARHREASPADRLLAKRTPASRA